MGVIGWLVLGLIAASLEKTILPRPGATFLGSLVLAWAGAALGGLLGSLLGWGDVSELTGRTLGLAVAGIVLILGGLRIVYRVREPAA
jgi:uncharacterized membrane protein YeaQ/YmgE (transglycosylase-associated protein family)